MQCRIGRTSNGEALIWLERRISLKPTITKELILYFTGSPLTNSLAAIDQLVACHDQLVLVFPQLIFYVQEEQILAWHTTIRTHFFPPRVVQSDHTDLGFFFHTTPYTNFFRYRHHPRCSNCCMRSLMAFRAVPVVVAETITSFPIVASRINFPIAPVASSTK